MRVDLVEEYQLVCPLFNRFCSQDDKRRRENFLERKATRLDYAHNVIGQEDVCMITAENQQLQFPNLDVAKNGIPVHISCHNCLLRSNHQNEDILYYQQISCQLMYSFLVNSSVIITGDTQ